MTEEEEPVRRSNDGGEEQQPETAETTPATLETAVAASASLRHPTHASLPQRIGRYRIVRELGRGGMGVVYEARQENPDRRVALKVISSGRVTPELLRRFDLEAQILGRLRHPSVAQIYEAGVHESDRGAQPYFAMELIEGKPLIKYADENGLKFQQRLELAVKVCEGVHHAHQKGVVHRDLKPANILVDRTGTPKILDFGVARATDADLQSTTLHTEIGQLVGTLPYMSPEQVAGIPEDLDARSDVYALGVVVFELLAGRLPYDVGKMMIHEAARVIREQEPTTLSAVNTVYRGDIELIVGKALEKEKERRYQSASELASDIQRYLSDEPIMARPPSTWYQFRKFVRRNRALANGVAAAFLLLVLGLIGTGLGFLRAERLRTIAEERSAELEKVAAFQGSRLADIQAERMGLDIRDWILGEYRETTGGGRDKEQIDELEQELREINFTNVAVEILDKNIYERSRQAIRSEFEAQPLLRARLLDALGTILGELGLIDRALVPAREALELRRDNLGPEHVDTLRSINNVAGLLLERRRSDEAEPLVNEALETARRELGDRHQVALEAVRNMGIWLWARGQHREAEPYYREAMEGMRETLGEEHPETLTSMNNLAFLVGELARPEEELILYQEVLEIRRRLLGDDHPETLRSINNLGPTLVELGRNQEAELYYREALDGRRRVLGDENSSTLTSMHNMGALLIEEGRYEEAEPLLREALEGRQRTLGRTDPATLWAVSRLGRLYRAQGRNAEAEPYYREAMDISRRTLGDQHPETLSHIYNMTRLTVDLGAFEESAQLAEESVRSHRLAYGEENQNTAGALMLLVHVYHTWNEAEPGAGHAEAGDAGIDEFAELTLRLQANGSFEDAARMANNHFRTCRGIYGSGDPRTEQAIEMAAAVHEAWHEADPEGGHAAEAAEWRARLTPSTEDVESR